MRVIGGKLRGRPLRSPPGHTTRPTAARVREALFSILGDLDGCSVLDACAGTGALGIEALSRGARHVTFLDADRSALTAIAGNLEALGLKGASTLLPLKLERASAALRRSAPFDLVLCDPPWPHADPIAAELVRVLSQGLLAPGARVVIGHRAELPVRCESATLVLNERRRWGDSGLSFFDWLGE
ncbi:MAG: 16S rRNA (guanine(966)-N(2))-methyltransferase RsmD [Polyangiaceae bacterium]|nr:16S rRNA (guanine(966)-N(2))-methyltransferase RsmD [Polyangiaceae bacterium]MCW5792315.1 16S rRNA (guanine(966)-N(2))-methyltransferase RsmD [Polyangiaceae bacterium]